MFLKQIFDPHLAQYAYLIGCQKTGESIIIDPERDIDRYREIAAANDLRITAIAETHIHADFLTGTREFLASGDEVFAYLSRMGGENWQYEWADGHDRVMLLSDGDTFMVGNIQIKAVHFPGHTPEHLCFLIEDQGGGADEPMALVSGDFMFVGDVGRPDLLESAAGEAGAREPAARTLYQSIQRFADFPEYLEILPGHGAGSACGKALGSIPFSTAGYELRFNGAVKTALTGGEDAFVDEILDGQPEPPMYFARMKKTNRAGADVLGSLPEPPMLSPEEIAELVPASDTDELVFLDTRSDRIAFMEDHLRGSLYAPPGSHFSVSAGSYVEAEKRIILLVEDNSDVDDFVRQLIRIGLDKIEGVALIEKVRGSAACRDFLVKTPTIATTEIPSDARVLDVRSVSEHEDAHIPGAHHLAHTRLMADRDQLPETGPITVHCASGMRASLAVPFLERIGYDVTYANGFFTDWKKENQG